MLLRDINPFLRNVVHAGRVTNLWNCTMQAFDCRLIYLAKGVIRVRVLDREYTIRAHTVLYFPPATPYSWLTQTEDCEYFNVNFDFTQQAAHITEWLYPQQTNCFDARAAVRTEAFSDAPFFNAPLILEGQFPLKSEFDRISELFMKKTALYREKISAVFKGVLYELAEQAQMGSNEKRDLQVLDQVLRFIHAHYADSGLTNPEICREMHYHPCYVNTLIKKSTGLSMHEYLVRYRVERSVELLLYSTKSIGAIAEEVGFVTANTYTIQFKRIAGVTPMDFRKGRRRSEGP